MEDREVVKKPLLRKPEKPLDEDLFADLKAFLSDFIDIPVVMHQSAEILKLVTKSTGLFVVIP